MISACRRAFFFIGVIGLPQSCIADTEEFDRPAITDHSFTIHQGAVNVETGFQHTHERQPDGSVEDFSFPTLLRFGLLKDFEGRLEADVASLSKSSVASEPDSSDLTTATIGGKYHFYQDESSPERTSLGLIGRVAPPGGEGPARAEHVTGDLRLAIDANVSDAWTVNANIGEATYENSDHDVSSTATGSVVLERKVSESTSLFGEVVYESLESAREANPGLYLDAGGAYKVTSHLQFDLYGGSGVRGIEPSDFFWSGGISYRFG